MTATTINNSMTEKPLHLLHVREARADLCLLRVPIPTPERAPELLSAKADLAFRNHKLFPFRDLQLWSIGILVILVLTSGLLAVVLPNMVWTQRVMHIEHSYLPQLFFGLISLILLFNIYLLAQKRNLNTTRLALIRELVLNERLESLS